MKRSFLFAAAICALPLFLVACQTPPPAPAGDTPPAKSASGPKGVSPTLADATAAAAAGMPSTQDKMQAHIYRGTGVVVRARRPAEACRRRRRRSPAAGGGSVLNFEGADLREVVRVSWATC